MNLPNSLYKKSLYNITFRRLYFTNRSLILLMYLKLNNIFFTGLLIIKIFSAWKYYSHLRKGLNSNKNMADSDKRRFFSQTTHQKFI